MPKANETTNCLIQRTTKVFVLSPFLDTSTGETSSLNPVKDKHFIHSSATHVEHRIGFLSNNPCNPFLLPNLRNLSFSRSIHDASLNTQAVIIANDKNPDVESSQIAEDTEKLLKMLTSHGTSSGIESVLNSADVQVSPALVVEVLKKLSNAGFLALSFFRWAEKQKGFKYSTESYNALIEALGKIKQFKMIWNLVSDMKQKGLLTKEAFALIARRYARARKAKEAIEAFESMERFGMKPELSDYNRLIDILSKSRHVERAQQVFDKWKNRKLEPDIKSYTILLEGWGQEQNLLRLDEVYREMRDDGFEPDVVTYGIIIHAYCSEKRLNEALEFFELSKASGFLPEAPTYNAVVGSYCWSMRIYDAYRVVDEMRKCGIGPNSRTYDIILHHLIKARRTKEAYSVFQKMSDEPGCEMSVSTYEIIVRMFCNQERVDMALRVWDQMKAKGVLPGMHMFSTLINSLCHDNKLDDACKYFEEMLNMGIRPPAAMFSHLKQALLDEGKKDTVLILAQRLDRIRKTPLIG
ncbi:hypothetical protein F0562_032588 [Nyssa sinensis]|uniref:Pentacotripeptide-repeat region of PRORP domain-containing protein n=1 Tax=Nyssa sinensis TaxID=561372 RepID=A0A5J5ARV9_9ASTE|nr:hypothetical protein F0562_032588 [Nyssa sinensis]